MDNADMPAAPLTGDAYTDFSHYDETNIFTSYNPQCQGLTKREHFAGLAMQAILTKGDISNQSEVASDALAYADELLAELNT